jgi:hypothetical protein
VRHEPSIEPLIDAAADAHARDPAKSLIADEAFRLTDMIVRLQRLDPNDPRCVGMPYAVQSWLSKGWRADLIQQSVEIVMAKRAEAPKSLRYFEAAIADAHAERGRPLPVSTKNTQLAPAKANGSTNGNISDALRRMSA